ncbi:hypothetical protein [Macrococcoides caseolyticum]|uniref:hypothetical protein n=1 Tax=Macrococcoides caseolyticum TaxID=69966 RepID=UPI001F1D8FB5|nr:hypothetical protein [Macrococcus caseolyticus]MCE4957724.1 hypothetical protein [Macrococcus caseolyticus]
MSKNTIFNALDSLMAYDLGATDSGISDDILRNDIKIYLLALENDEFRVIITEFIQIHFCNEKAVASGYGVEDIKLFINWLENFLNISL